ncbi:O-antigen ligase [Aerococcus sp. 150760007-1]|uniref:O-antigen ligase family protein n=1 Tax=Aerococcus urinaeequi TaxID=51665 RepID=A0ABR5ZZ22_9LACT|nr:O-antigen ligase family protein [Aerococcus urinaeequi]MBA5746958.1 O-antigen ligase family protein [Aerococcus urinaeequi]MBA5829742.1 O-antigen ligase family protein [Aerococcus urinaeequi]MBA5860784.1 O-antigen ligase family protein [Aerococcus urinaeequi]
MDDFSELIYKKEHTFLDDLLIFTISSFLFGIWFVPYYTAVWGIVLFIFDLFYLLMRGNLKIKLNIENLSWIGFLIFLVIGAFISENQSESFQYVVTVILFWLNYLILSDNKNWAEQFIKNMEVICIIFTLGSVIQIVAPNILISINNLHLFGQELVRATNFVQLNVLVGFTSQSGINGFIMSILLILILIKFLYGNEKKQKYLYLTAYLFVFYLIFLTEKRGFLIFNILITIYLFAINYEKKYKIIFPIIVIIIAFLLVLFRTDIGNNILERTMVQDDISSGRFPMYRAMWNDFINNPIFGNGTYSTIQEFSAGHGHNIYIQVLRENGIFGFLFFIMLIGFTFIKTQLAFKTYLNTTTKMILSLSIGLQLLFILWGMTGNPLYDVFALFTYFIAIALPYGIKTKGSNYL